MFCVHAGNPMVRHQSQNTEEPKITIISASAGEPKSQRTPRSPSQRASASSRVSESRPTSVSESPRSALILPLRSTAASCNNTDVTNTPILQDILDYIKGKYDVQNKVSSTPLWITLTILGMTLIPHRRAYLSFCPCYGLAGK